MSYSSFIIVRGAREHNLRNIDVDLPRNSLVVITGPSGSGKSSLAFDTIYAEGQRRYLESLSAYARQFLETMQKPEVDRIDGLSPAIAIEQKTTSRNPRSTVGTVTEIYDYMRLLFARVGIAFSPETGLPIERQSISQMVDRVMSLDEGTRLYILAPIVRDRKGEYKKLLEDLQKKGFQRVKVNGSFFDLDTIPTLNRKERHSIDVVVDRVVLKNDIQTRLADSMETALSLADGLVVVELAHKAESLKKNETNSVQETQERFIFSQKFSCPVSGFSLPEIEPRLFSFNSPSGACFACNGIGSQYRIDVPLLLEEIEQRTIREILQKLWKKPALFHQETICEELASFFHFSTESLFVKLSEEAKKILLYGSEKKKGTAKTKTVSSSLCEIAFQGIIPHLEYKWETTEAYSERNEIENLMALIPCPSCLGDRLKPEALCVRIAGKHISEVSHFSIQEAIEWFSSLPHHMSAKQREIASRILKEIQERLRFLNEVGLDYLTLSRSSGSLSGGESQRIRLASQIGSGLTGVLYVLDEPSIGLHQRDNDRLLSTLKYLRDLGNSVLVVEHDEDAILQADYILDMGPGAGEHGGIITAKGTPQEIMNNLNSLTGRYLSGNLRIEIPSQRRKAYNNQHLCVLGAKGNNLKNICVKIPLGTLTCITGVSGCGKSTFLMETLFCAASNHIMKSRKKAKAYDTIEGFEFLDKVIDINQSPIGRTPRSNPATYTGAFTPIREFFSSLPESRARGYSSGRFSFNVKGGRCEACQGDGTTKISMHFLPDIQVTCDICKGKRYNRETLEITFKGQSISDVLAMTVEESLTFFSTLPSIKEKLTALFEVGLGYIQLGQDATTLSGGEAQRIKLAKELARKSTGKTLYILDEPTTGLHFHDIAKLLDVLHRLVDQGNSVIIIEHNLDVIKTADWIIDLGPEGGDKGGEIVAQGPPETIIQEPRSHTGYFLKKLFEKQKKKIKF